MIDFRYHVVSIIAIFLALTVGLVIGASVLEQPLVDGLKHQITSDSDETSKLQQENRSLNTDYGQLSQYVDETKDSLVNNQLVNVGVDVVRIANSNETYNDAAISLLRQAGCIIDTDITINETFADPSSTQQLAEVVSAFTPTKQPVSGTGAVAAMNLLAEALTAPSPESSDTPGSPAAQTTPQTMTFDWALKTLQAFAQQGVITINTAPSQATWVKPGAAFIAAPLQKNTAAENTAYSALAQAVRADQAGVVVAGDSTAADSNGLIGAVLADKNATKTVSTVDDMDQTIGQVAVVFVLYEQISDPSETAGHYGTVGSNDGLLPKLPTLPSPPSG